MTENISPAELHGQLNILTYNPHVLLLDVRTSAEFMEEHIHHFQNIPLAILSSQLASLAGKDRIYVYCRSGKRAAQAVEILAQLAHITIINLEGGLVAWKLAGLPTVTSDRQVPLIRQVFIAISLLLWIGLVGYALSSYIWLSLIMIVATGLLISGITGWCGMAKILGMMPWNKQKVR